MTDNDRIQKAMLAPEPAQRELLSPAQLGDIAAGVTLVLAAAHVIAFVVWGWI